VESLTQLSEILKENQLLSAGLGLSSATIIGFWLKDFPRMIYNFIKREFTTQLTITSHNIAFHNLLRWIENNYKNKKFRKLKLTNGKWGEGESITSIGYGFHTILYKRQLLFIELTKDAANQTERDKETVTIMKIGRGRQIFDDLIDDIKEVKDESKMSVYKMDSGGYWTEAKQIKKRTLDSIFIEKYKKELFINTVNNFINNEKWYIDNGIPYQLGILLYGSPGTGKTSIIKAISSYLNYPIYYIPASIIYAIEKGLLNIPERCIMVIEDIDTSVITHKRRSKVNKLDEEQPGISTVENVMDDFALTTLSDILNSLDGLFSIHGRILIATTNHIENLDPALIRPGRIDLQIEVGFINIEILSLFINRFFPDNKIDYTNIEIKNEITVAVLQNMVLSNYSLEKILTTIINNE